MRAETRLDAAVFLLTPTRTRCELVLRANGETEKIASGLLNPFLGHLKTAREQMAKGGYSITLEPHPDDDAVWFTKATLERFVRFVSTPDVLERVDTIESEIMQFNEAIRIQSFENFYLNTVEEESTGFRDHIAGSRKSYCSDAASAIVLYQPGLFAESGGWKARPEDSKENFLRVLESRKMVLQNEQGMAFARAAAAGFHAENMADLVSFAEYFGAKRLLKACLRFEELWRSKDETGRQAEDVDIHPPDAMSTKSEFPSCTSSTDVRLSPNSAKRRDFTEQWAASHPNMMTSDNHENSPEGRSQNQGWSSQVPVYGHPYYVLPHCPVHSTSSVPPFHYQSYPMPWYQTHFNYGQHYPMANGEPGSNVDQRTHNEEGQRNGSSDSGGGQMNGCAQGRELGGCRNISQNQGPCIRSSSSEFQTVEPVSEERTLVSRNQEQDREVDPGNWCIPPSLLPRIGEATPSRGGVGGEDPVLDCSRGQEFIPEEITPLDECEKQQPRRDQGDASVMMMMTGRGMAGETDSHDVAREYSEILMRSFASRVNGPEEESVDAAKNGAEVKEPKKEKKITTVGSLLRKKSNPSKLSPSAEAQTRANKLRAFKVDLQRAKREKEEEEQRRLEELKQQRQQRIAARSSTAAARSPATPKPKLPSSSSSRLAASATSKSKLGGPSSSAGSLKGAAVSARLARLVPSLPAAAKWKDEAGASSSLPKIASRALRKFSEPRGSGSQRLPSWRSMTVNVGQHSGSSSGRRMASPESSTLASRLKKTAGKSMSSSSAASGEKKGSTAAPMAGGRLSQLLGSKKKGSTEVKERDKEKKTLAEMGNRFPQVEAAPPPVNDVSCGPSSTSNAVIAKEERKIAAPAKELLAKSVRFSLSDEQQYENRGQHRRAASMEEAYSMRKQRPGEGRGGMVAPVGGQKDVGGGGGGSRGGGETLRGGLRKLFNLGKKTDGHSALHEPGGFRRFSILSSFRSKKSYVV